MAQISTDGARAELASTINNADTSLDIASGGSLFPVANTGTDTIGDSKDWFKLVIQDDTGFEIVYVRTHTGGSNTFSHILRGQEGTTARNFSVPSPSGAVPIVGIRLTAKDFNDLNRVDNTRDADKPISSAVASALAEKVGTSDARLTDARDWNAFLVPQAEAEAGTATTARKWSAQRVRQAITAWWNGISVPVAKITGLGTSATKNVGTGIGQLMEVGAFGIGIAGMSTVDPDANTASGIFTIGATAKPVPGGSIQGWSTYLNLMRSTHGEQLFLRNGFMAFRTKASGGVSDPWGPLYTVWHGGNFNPDDKLNKTGDTIGAGTKESVFTSPTVGITDGTDPFRQVQLTANVTATVNLSVGASRSVWINPGTFTVTWPAGIWWGGGDAPDLPSNKWSLLTFTGRPGGNTAMGALVVSEP